jgi:AraC-like DNA-binding protein
MSTDVTLPAKRAALHPSRNQPCGIVSRNDRVFSARVVCGLLSWSDENQVDPGDLVSGLDARDPETLLSYVAIRDGFARARTRHGSDALAIVTGSRKTVHHLGPLGPAQVSQPTLGAAMHWGLDRQFHVGSLLRMSLGTTSSEAIFECHRIFDDDECGVLIDVDHMVAVYNIMSMFTQAPLAVERIELASSSADLAGALHAILKAPVVLGQARSKLVVQASALDTPNPRFDEMTRRFWTTLCDKEILDNSRPEPLSLKELLESQEDIPSITKLAQRLHVSERTMHRMLVREGIDFSQVVDAHCQRRAEALLKRGVSTEAVAEDLHFADERSFRRAFQRWTGISPSVFRARYACSSDAGAKAPHRADAACSIGQA